VKRGAHAFALALVGVGVGSVGCHNKAAPPPIPSPIELAMVPVPEGTFSMGSAEGDEDERPVHAVHVAGFAIQKTETRVAEYARCEAAGACTKTPEMPYCNEWEKDRAAHPMNCVTFAQATAFCAWAQARLPSEAEWEYAARGANGGKYPWGNAGPDATCLCWDGHKSDLGLGKRRSTCEAGSHPAGASPFGVLDLAGNVWEWTSDLYSRDYQSARIDVKRVVRGGTWYSYDPADVRATLRFREREDKADYGVGFRCVR
jgi:formylglycine-generating enzyme required for sulfatase activity